MQESIEGIIVYETPYSESSKILQILTKKYGLIGVLAKGSKSIKSKLAAKTQKFTYATFHIGYKENKLSTLYSADIINTFEHIRGDIVLISYLSYLCELAYQVSKQNNDSLIYDYLITGINKIEEGLDPLVITNIVEIKYLDFLGINLNMDTCIKCGSNKNIITINPNAGGYICKNCYDNEFVVSPKTIKTIRNYYYIDLNSVSDIKISDVVKNEINLFLTNYYDIYTGLYIKSKEFLNKLINK